MHKAALVGVTLLVLLLYMIAEPFHANQSEPASSGLEKQVLTSPKTYLENKSVHETSPTVPNNTLVNALSTLDLTNLRTVIEQFWQQCRAVNHCQEQLQIARAQLSQQRFLLLQEYPDRLQHYQQLLANSESLHDRSLQEKIAAIRDLQLQAFGTQAHSIFATTYDYYAEKAADEEMRQSLKHLPLSQQITGFDADLKKRRRTLSKQQRFQAAQSLVTAENDSPQYYQEQQQLIRYYFNDEEATPYLDQLKQQQQQQEQAEHYQNGLQVLQTRLSQQRKNTYRDLDDEQWQQHQARALREYRLNFFQAAPLP